MLSVHLYFSILTVQNQTRIKSTIFWWMLFCSKVGETSRADTSKKKSIVTHAVNAAKAAIEQGIVPGELSYS